MSFSDIKCSFLNFSPNLQENWFQNALWFYGESFAVRSDDTIWLGHCVHFLQCYSDTYFIIYSSKSSFYHLMSGGDGGCGKQGTWSWVVCFASPLFSPASVSRAQRCKSVLLRMQGLLWHLCKPRCFIIFLLYQLKIFSHLKYKLLEYCR